MIRVLIHRVRGMGYPVWRLDSLIVEGRAGVSVLLLAPLYWGREGLPESFEPATTAGSMFINRRRLAYFRCRIQSETVTSITVSRPMTSAAA